MVFLPLKWLVKANMEIQFINLLFQEQLLSITAKNKREDTYADIPWIIKELEKYHLFKQIALHSLNS